jgi:ubiquinone/menaquinone biosynthesis C-methylase UbiE
MSGTKPQKSVVKFAKVLKKARRELVSMGELEESNFSGLKVLDLGCGEGKNALYFAERGAQVVGIDISHVAILNAQNSARSESLGQLIEFTVGSMGEVLPYADASFDIILDVTSSNALSTPERSVYLSEVRRVLKSGGKLFVRALCKDGDANAKHLLKESPSHERDTYIMPVSGLVERVFTRDDIMTIYSEYFNIESIEKETHYTQMQAKSGEMRKFKRNFWILHMTKA